jgi:hypothetical protein
MGTSTTSGPIFRVGGSNGTVRGTAKLVFQSDKIDCNGIAAAIVAFKLPPDCVVTKGALLPANAPDTPTNALGTVDIGTPNAPASLGSITDPTNGQDLGIAALGVYIDTGDNEIIITPTNVDGYVHLRLEYMSLDTSYGKENI